jgi:hypothetical protein
LIGYPSPEREWDLDKKFAAIKSAGFDTVVHPPFTGLRDLLDKHRLRVIGYLASGNASEFEQLLEANKHCGATHINVHLGTGKCRTTDAVGLAIVLMQKAQALELAVSIEFHRDTCTQTLEKTLALAKAYHVATGEVLPLTWDFSHIAVVKSRGPAELIELLPKVSSLIQRAQQFHFRPFNAHHCQVPVTDGAGNLSPETQEWLPFAESVLKCWLEGNRETTREVFVCPEMGPLTSGYNVSSLPNSWEDAQCMRLEVQKMWNNLLPNRSTPHL